MPAVKDTLDDHSARDRKAQLWAAQIELVKLQRHVIETGKQVLLIFEGRDGAGKDGAIKRIVQHLSRRDARVVALGPPSDRERRTWYYQRYAAHLPIDGEIVLFNRSWYNRAGVEHVMSFCSKTEYKMFFKAKPLFEDLLVHCGISLVKYYLDISKAEQKRRLKDRRDDPLTQWKSSTVTVVAVKHWDEYTDARDAMLSSTHSKTAPWTIVQADDKPLVRSNIIKVLLTQLDFPGKNSHANSPDPEIIFPFTEAVLRDGRLAK